MVGIVNVKPENDYKLLVTFSNGKKGIFDVKPYLEVGSVFKELKDPSVFKSVRTNEYPTVEWSNGADLCPDCVYAQTKFL